MRLWRRCDETGAFDASISETVGSFSYTTQPYWNDEINSYSTTRLEPISIDTVITRHHDICQPRYIADGRCPRAVIGALGDLYSRDLCFSLSLGTLLSLLRATPQAQRLKQWFIRKIFCKPDYEARASADRLVTGAVLLLELPIILGFCYPILPLLASVAMLLNAGVFHVGMTRLGLKLSEDPPARVSIKYLWISLTLGCAIPSWLYMESGLSGKWVITLGMPFTALLAAKTWYGTEKSGHGDDLTPHEEFMVNKYTHNGRRYSPIALDDETCLGCSPYSTHVRWQSPAPESAPASVELLTCNAKFTALDRAMANPLFEEYLDDGRVAAVVTV